jgi:hypothetical protein
VILSFLHRLSNAAAAAAVASAGAHAAVVTSQEGLAASIPSTTLATHLATAADSRNTPAQRTTATAAAAAAVLQAGAGRSQLLLLEARQQLAVCLSCWQKCGWWPDAVGAVLGEYPSASAALNQIAAEEAAARAKVGNIHLYMWADLLCVDMCRLTCGAVSATGNLRVLRA